MIHRIHILGASGSGTTTLGRALAKCLQCPHFDTDDYFWVPTDPPYTHRRARTERQQLLMEDLTAQDVWVLSGSLCGWGDVAIPFFELVIFLAIPQDIRMARLRQRELARFGERMLPGGDMYETSQALLAWAASYDAGGVDIRSRQRHNQWLSTLPCPILCFEGAYSIEAQRAVLMVEIQPSSGDAFARPLMSLRTIPSPGLPQDLLYAHLSSIFLPRSVVVPSPVSSHEGTSCVTGA